MGRHRGPGPRRRHHPRDLRRAPGRDPDAAADQHLARPPRRPVRPGRASRSTAPVVRPGASRSPRPSPARASGSPSPSAPTRRPGPASSGSAGSWSARRSRARSLHLSQAQGEFTLTESPATPTNNHLLMISGGSGITPVMSQVRTLLRDGYDGKANRKVTFLHYARSEEDQIFAEELRRIQLEDNHVDVHLRYGDDVFSAESLARLVPDFRDTDTWACGPAPMMAAGHTRRTTGRRACAPSSSSSPPPSAPAPAPPRATSPSPGPARAPPTPATSILEQAEAAGLTPEYGCRMGICFSCVSRKTEGTVRNVLTGEESSLPDEDIRICVSRPRRRLRRRPLTHDHIHRKEGTMVSTSSTIEKTTSSTRNRQQADPRAARGVRQRDGRHPPAPDRRARRGGRGVHPRHRQEAAPVRGRRPRADVPPAGLAAGRRRAERLQDPRQHGDRPQRHARPVRLDGRPRPELADVRVGQRLPQRPVEVLATTTSTTPSPTSSARTATSATASCGWTRTRSGTRTTWATRSTRSC